MLGLYLGLYLLGLDLDFGLRIGVRGTITVSSRNEWLTLVYGGEGHFDLGACGCSANFVVSGSVEPQNGGERFCVYIVITHV